MAFKHYFYQEQTRNYMLQFANLFSGLRVKTGKRATGQSIFVTVPVRFASMDRMTNMLAQSHGNPDPDLVDTINTSVPIMSVNMAGIQPRPEARRGVGIIDRNSYLTVEDVGEAVDDADQASKIRVKARSMPNPFLLTMELHIFASNTDQHLQMLEQLIMIFNPDITIQSNDSMWDWTALTSVTLTDIGLNTEIPISTEMQVIGSTLTFDVPIWISGPMIEVNGHVAAVRTNFRDGSEYTGSLDDLTIGDDSGSIPDGITSDGISIDMIGTPVDNSIDENGYDSGHDIPE